MSYLDYEGLVHLWNHIIARLNSKIEIIDGKGLSTNDYTDEDKAKLVGAVAAIVDLKNKVGTMSVEDQIAAAIAALVDSAPETMDTLNELATAIKNNQDVVGALNAAIGNKMDANNPTGTGSFSMNRAEGSTIGNYSHAEGRDTIASGEFSHAEGKDTDASGTASHAEGNATTAEGNCSHAEGQSTGAYGLASHAEGQDTWAEGNYSHAEGWGTNAYGKSSHAEGEGIEAYGECQHVQGRYNIADEEGVYAHIVGNGSIGNLSNTHTLDWDGNAWFAGDIYVGSTSGTNRDEGSRKLITAEDIGTEVLITIEDIDAICGSVTPISEVLF